MRLRGGINALACGFAFALASTAGGQEDPNRLGCLVELELPGFITVNKVPEGGNFEVEIAVGPDGRSAGVAVQPAPPTWLLWEIENSLRDKAVYDPQCAGQKVKLRFSFRVEGEPRPNPFVRVSPSLRNLRREKPSREYSHPSSDPIFRVLRWAVILPRVDACVRPECVQGHEEEQE